MALPYAFSNNTAPTGPQLDADLQQLGEQSVRPCTAAGTNSITLAINANVSAITAYANYQRFSAVAAATNTGAVQARVGSLALLNVYRDTPAGPVVLVGGEIVINCAFVLVYDSALNTGAGGFHLISQANAFPWTGGTISNGSIVITNSTLSTLYLTGASINAPTLTANVGSIANFTAATLASANGSLTAMMVGASASSLTRQIAGLATLTYTLMNANTSQSQQMTVAGVQVNDVVALGPPATITTGLGFTGFVPAAGTISVRALNITAGTIGAFTVVMRAVATSFA